MWKIFWYQCKDFRKFSAKFSDFRISENFRKIDITVFVKLYDLQVPSSPCTADNHLQIIWSGWWPLGGGHSQSIRTKYAWCIRTGHFPKTWKLGTVSLLHKGGPSTDPNNYRGIRKTFEYLDAEMFCLLFRSLVRPHIEYANPRTIIITG